VAVARGIKNIDPSLTDAQVANVVNNRLGTYVGALEPQFIKVWKYYDAFARAGVALGKTGVRSLANASTLGAIKQLGGYSQAASLWTTAVTGLAIIKLLDAARPNKKEGEGGRWAWDIPDLKLGNAPVWAADGKRYDIPLMRLAANAVSRGFNHTGAKALLEAYWAGETDEGELMLEMTKGIANSNLFHRMGPHLRGGFEMFTGKVPHMTSPDEFMSAYPPTMQGEMGERLKGLIKPMIPFYTKPAEAFNEHSRGHPDTTFGKILYATADIFGVAPTIRPEIQELRAGGREVRTKAYEADQVVKYIVYELANIPPGEERNAFFRRALEERLPPEVRAQSAQRALEILFRLPTKYTKDMAKQRLMEAGMEGAYMLGR